MPDASARRQTHSTRPLARSPTAPQMPRTRLERAAHLARAVIALFAGPRRLHPRHVAGHPLERLLLSQRIEGCHHPAETITGPRNVRRGAAGTGAHLRCNCRTPVSRVAISRLPSDTNIIILIGIGNPWWGAHANNCSHPTQPRYNPNGHPTPKHNRINPNPNATISLLNTIIFATYFYVIVRFFTDTDRQCVYTDV